MELEGYLVGIVALARYRADQCELPLGLRAWDLWDEDAGCVHQLDVRREPEPLELARDTGAVFGLGRSTAQEAVNDRRLSRIRHADDNHARQAAALFRSRAHCRED